MKTLHDAVGGRMVTGCAGAVGAEDLAEGAEELRFELFSLVRRDGVRRAKARHPTGDETIGNFLCRDGLEGPNLRPASETVDGGEAVAVGASRWKRSDEVDVYVLKPG